MVGLAKELGAGDQAEPLMMEVYKFEETLAKVSSRNCHAKRVTFHTIHLIYNENTVFGVTNCNASRWQYFDSVSIFIVTLCHACPFKSRCSRYGVHGA